MKFIWNDKTPKIVNRFWKRYIVNENNVIETNDEEIKEILLAYWFTTEEVKQTKVKK